MKLKYLIGTAITCLFVLACEKEQSVGSFADFSVDKTFVSIDMGGGSSVVTVSSGGTWEVSKHYDTGKKDANNKTIYTECPDWITLSTLSGPAGESKLTISATATEGGREVELQLRSGDHLQHLIVRQGTLEASAAKVSEVLSGPDGKNYQVKGIVTRIANTTYGNWYLDDGTGEVYIYGTLDKDGKAGANNSIDKWNIEVGDEITVEGPKTTYNGTVELVNVAVIKLTKSLVKVIGTEVSPVGTDDEESIAKEGGELRVKLAYKAKIEYPVIAEKDRSWISYKNTEYKAGVETIFEANPADTAIVTFSIAENFGAARVGSVSFTAEDANGSSSVSVDVKQAGSILTVSVADFLAAPVSSAIYKITGVITSVANASYGNVYVRDFSGEAYVYGIGARGDFEASGLKAGDIVTLLGNRGDYKGSPQMTGGKLDSFIPVTEADIPTVLGAADGEYFRVSGTVTKIANDTYGNVYLSDGTNELYVYGTYPGVGAAGDARKGVVAREGIEVGDKLTVFGPKSTYNGTPQINGGMFWSLEKGGQGGGEGGEGGEAGEFDTTVSYTKGSSCYDDGVMNITLGEKSFENVFTLKLGTGSKFGDGTITLPAGTKKLSYYAVAWKNAPASLQFSIGDSVVGTQKLAANDGASGNSPYTATVSSEDKYELVFESALDAETSLKVETYAGENTGCRAILFGIKAVK